MELYGVVTMDIVGSRKIENRVSFQRDLKNLIDMINKKYSDILPVPAAITLGDEWQLITSRPWECYNLIHEFQQLLWPHDINLYAGIGLGNITTDINSDIRSMDGPCFHMAREAINTVKSFHRKKESTIHSKHNKVFFKGQQVLLINSIHLLQGGSGFSSRDMEDAGLIGREIAVSSADFSREQGNVKAGDIIGFSMEHIINNIIENNEILKQKMTPKQKRIYIEYLKAGSYRKLLESEELSRESTSSISQKLNTAEFFTIQYNHRFVTSLLYNYCSDLKASREN